MSKSQEIAEEKPVHEKSQETVTAPVISDTDVKEKSGEDKPAGFSNYWRIFTFCTTLDVFLYAVAIVAAIAAGATLPLMTVVFGQFVTRFNNYTTSNQLGTQAFRDDIDNFVLYFVYLFAGNLVVSYTSVTFASIAGIRVTRTIRKRFLESTLRQDIAYFDKSYATNGSISSQVTTNGNRINLGIGEKVTILVQTLALFFSAFIVALVENWKLALLNMCVIPVVMILMSVIVKIDAQAEARATGLQSTASSLAQEALSSVRTVQAFWAHGQIVEKYDKHLNDAYKIGLKRSTYGSLVASTYYFAVYAGTALVFWYGFRLYGNGELASPGEVLTVVLSMTAGTMAIALITPMLQAIVNAAAAATELFSIMEKTSAIDPLSDDGESPTNCSGDIAIENVTFAYPSRPSVNVLTKFSLVLPAGKRIALVGPSGCGKSTLVALVERWYDPSSGGILLDGKKISSYNLRWLRSKIRLVQQEPVLFRGTIFDNVAKGLIGPQLDLPEDQKLELVKSACKQSNAHEFVENLPDDYNTQVGERASMLSGGQKQRLAIARSIISNPDILLLDEATSALDTRAESAVQDALDKASENRTTLVIAHKLSTIQNADNIVVMSDGNIVEQGTHSSLLAADGLYASLVAAQQLKSKEADSEDEIGERLIKAGTKASEKRVLHAEVSDDTQADTDSTPKTLDHGFVHCFSTMLSDQRDQWPWFVLLIIGCTIGGATFPAQAILFSRLIDVFTLQGQAAVDRGNFFAAMYVVLAVGNLLAYGSIYYGGNIVAQTISYRYRKEMLRRFLYCDQEFFDRPENSSGALTSRLSSLPDHIMELTTMNLYMCFMCLVTIIASAALAIATGWKLGLVVVFTGIPIFIVAGVARVKLEAKFEQDTNDRFAESAALATEAVTNIRTVASLALEQNVCDEYNASLDRISKSGFRTVSLTSFAYAFTQSLEFLLQALGFWYGSRLLGSGEYNTTQFYVVFLSVLFGGQAAGQGIAYLPSMARAQLAANYVLWLRQLKPSIGEDENNKDIGPDGDEPIEFKDVEFRYKQREAATVIDGISMTIPPGSYTAFVGPSGCGKSTLIALLERFYDPTIGTISLGPTPLPILSPRLYRNQISLVQQEPTLYEGSVRDNITLGLTPETPSSSITDERLESACRAANALDFIRSLPEGLNTPCGSKGLQFSGGQRQRIAIARALIRDPKILLLDEATSALDTGSERVVQQALDGASRGGKRTTVAVAHRLSTIRHADVILVLAEGKIVERGSHEELLRARGRYWEMCMAQSLSEGGT